MNLQEYERLRKYMERGQYRHQFFPGFSWMEGCPYGLGKESRIRSVEGLVRRLPRDYFVLADMLLTAWELLISEAQSFPQFRLHDEFFLFVNMVRNAIALREGLSSMAEFDRWRESDWYDGTDSVQPPQWIPLLKVELELDAADDLTAAILGDERGEDTLGYGVLNETNEKFDVMIPLPFPFYELGYQETLIIAALGDWTSRSTPPEGEFAQEEGEGLMIVEMFAYIYAALQVKMAALEDSTLVLDLEGGSVRARILTLGRKAYKAFIDRWIDLVLCRYPFRGARNIEFG